MISSQKHCEKNTFITPPEDLALEDLKVFQQGNDPKHTSRQKSKWLNRQGVTALEWPSQFPDLNPTEKLWKEKRIKYRKKQNSNHVDLERICIKEWGKI